MYFAQLCVWVIVVTIVNFLNFYYFKIKTKFFLLGIQKLISGFLEDFGNTILSPFKNNGKLKLVMVMILIPLILNAINFWVIDNILKLKADENEDELKEIYKETNHNQGFDNPNPQYIQINFDNHVIKKEEGVDNQIELKNLSENNDIVGRNSSN